MAQMPETMLKILAGKKMLEGGLEGFSVSARAEKLKKQKAAKEKADVDRAYLREQGDMVQKLKDMSTSFFKTAEEVKKTQDLAEKTRVEAEETAKKKKDTPKKAKGHEAKAKSTKPPSKATATPVQFTPTNDEATLVTSPAMTELLETQKDLLEIDKKRNLREIKAARRALEDRRDNRYKPPVPVPTGSPTALKDEDGGGLGFFPGLIAGMSKLAGPLLSGIIVTGAGVLAALKMTDLAKALLKLDKNTGTHKTNVRTSGAGGSGVKTEGPAGRYVVRTKVPAGYHYTHSNGTTYKGGQFLPDDVTPDMLKKGQVKVTATRINPTPHGTGQNLLDIDSKKVVASPQGTKVVDISGVGDTDFASAKEIKNQMRLNKVYEANLKIAQSDFDNWEKTVRRHQQTYSFGPDRSMGSDSGGSHGKRTVGDPWYTDKVTGERIAKTEVDAIKGKYLSAVDDLDEGKKALNYLKTGVSPYEVGEGLESTKKKVDGKVVRVFSEVDNPNQRLGSAHAFEDSTPWRPGAGTDDIDKMIDDGPKRDLSKAHLTDEAVAKVEADSAKLHAEAELKAKSKVVPLKVVGGTDVDGGPKLTGEPDKLTLTDDVKPPAAWKGKVQTGLKIANRVGWVLAALDVFGKHKQGQGLTEAVINSAHDIPKAMLQLTDWATQLATFNKTDGLVKNNSAVGRWMKRTSDVFDNSHKWETGMIASFFGADEKARNYKTGIASVEEGERLHDEAENKYGAVDVGHGQGDIENLEKLTQLSVEHLDALLQHQAWSDKDEQIIGSILDAKLQGISVNYDDMGWLGKEKVTYGENNSPTVNRLGNPLEDNKKLLGEEKIMYMKALENNEEGAQEHLDHMQSLMAASDARMSIADFMALSDVQQKTAKDAAMVRYAELAYGKDQLLAQGYGQGGHITIGDTSYGQGGVEAGQQALAQIALEEAKMLKSGMTAEEFNALTPDKHVADTFYKAGTTEGSIFTNDKHLLDYLKSVWGATGGRQWLSDAFMDMDNDIAVQYGHKRYGQTTRPDWGTRQFDPAFGEAKGASMMGLDGMGHSIFDKGSVGDASVAKLQSGVGYVAQFAYQMAQEGIKAKNAGTLSKFAWFGQAIADMNEEMTGYNMARKVGVENMTADLAWKVGELTDRLKDKSSPNFQNFNSMAAERLERMVVTASMALAQQTQAVVAPTIVNADNSVKSNVSHNHPSTAHAPFSPAGAGHMGITTPRG